MNPAVVSAAAGVVFDDRGQLLLVERARPPSAGCWSIPGGKSLPGEHTARTCVREVAEETGLVVRVAHLLGRVHRDGPDGVVFEIDDYLCTLVGGRLQAGDDAARARWVDPQELPGLPLVPGLLAALTEWDTLPRDVR